MIAIVFILAVGCLVGLVIACAENALPHHTDHDTQEQQP